MADVDTARSPTTAPPGAQHHERGHRAVGPRPVPGPALERGVRRQGPLEVLLVAAHGHEVGCGGQQLDHVGGRAAPRSAPSPVPEAPPTDPGQARGGRRAAEQEHGQHQAAGRQHQGHDGHRDQRGGHGHEERGDAAQVDVLEQVDVGGGPGQQVAVPPSGHPGGRAGGDLVVEPESHPPEGAEGGVVGHQPLGVAQRPPAEGQELHGGHQQGQGVEGRPQRRLVDEGARAGQQAHGAQRGRRAERGAERGTGGPSGAPMRRIRASGPRPRIIRCRRRRAAVGAVDARRPRSDTPAASRCTVGRRPPPGRPPG